MAGEGLDTHPIGALTLPLRHLDTLWLQVAGTLCNIACKHCFVSAGPKVETHRFMSVDAVDRALDQALQRGMRAVWFTGGEPFLHPRILELVDRALAVAPLGILTNGMLIDGPLADALGRRFREAPYNLEIRVSLDGSTEAENDPMRGRGVFRAATLGIANLAAAGVDPIVAVTTVEGADTSGAGPFVELLRSLGVRHPRVKWIPPFRIGREARRRGGRGYHDWERLTAEDLADPDAVWRLQCGTSRCVTSEGAFPCPILVNDPSARLGDDLEDALRPHRVDHPACHTCWAESFSCSM